MKKTQPQVSSRTSFGSRDIIGYQLSWREPEFSIRQQQLKVHDTEAQAWEAWDSMLDADEALDKKCESIVSRHVLVAATELVNVLSGDEKYSDDLYVIMSQPDFETAAREQGFNVEQQPDGYWLTWDEGGEKQFDGSYITAVDAWENCCVENCIDYEQEDALEFWIVSDSLAHHLEKRGEMVLNDFHGLTLWGRCESGVEIYTDVVMQQIAAQTAI